MAEDFISPAKASNDYGLPERIVKELTHEEMKDLKQIFDLFDVAGTGYGIFEPRQLSSGFRPGLTQTGLYNHRRRQA